MHELWFDCFVYVAKCQIWNPYYLSYTVCNIWICAFQSTENPLVPLTGWFRCIYTYFMVMLPTILCDSAKFSRESRSIAYLEVTSKSTGFILINTANLLVKSSINLNLMMNLKMFHLFSLPQNSVDSYWDDSILPAEFCHTKVNVTTFRDAPILRLS